MPHPQHSSSDRLAAPSSSPTGQSAPSHHLLLHLMATRPLAFLGSLWVTVVLIAIVALGGLISPTVTERRSVSITAVGSESSVASEPVLKQRQMPFWLFGAIAISCTAGSIFVSRQLNPSQHRQKRSLKRPLRRATSKAIPPLRGHKRPKPRKRIPVRHPIARSLQPLSPPPSLTSSASSLPQVSPYPLHPLPTGSPRVADAVDIRKQRSLSSWL
jgi:hypothetical protein